MDSWKRRKGVWTVEVIHTRTFLVVCLFDTRPNFCCAPSQWLKTLSFFFFFFFCPVVHGIYLLNIVVRIKKHSLDGMKVTCLLLSPLLHVCFLFYLMFFLEILSSPQYFIYSFNHNFLYISLFLSHLSLSYFVFSHGVYIFGVFNKYFPSF